MVPEPPWTTSQALSSRRALRLAAGKSMSRGVPPPGVRRGVARVADRGRGVEQDRGGHRPAVEVVLGGDAGDEELADIIPHGGNAPRSSSPTPASIRPVRAVSSRRPRRGAGLTVEGGSWMWGDSPRRLPEGPPVPVARVGGKAWGALAGGVERHQRSWSASMSTNRGPSAKAHAGVDRLSWPPADCRRRRAARQEEHRGAVPGRKQSGREGPDRAIPDAYGRDLRAGEDQADRVAPGLGAAGMFHGATPLPWKIGTVGVG